jgi:hypothetical protein
LSIAKSAEADKLKATQHNPKQLVQSARSSVGGPSRGSRTSLPSGTTVCLLWRGKRHVLGLDIPLFLYLNA